MIFGQVGMAYQLFSIIFVTLIIIIVIWCWRDTAGLLFWIIGSWFLDFFLFSGFFCIFMVFFFLLLALVWTYTSENE